MIRVLEGLIGLPSSVCGSKVMVMGECYKWRCFCVFLATFAWHWTPTHWAIILAQDLFGNYAEICQNINRSVKTLDDVNVPWEFKNRADFVARNVAGFKWILGHRTSH